MMLKKYFLHHLGDFSISVLDNLVSVDKSKSVGSSATNGEWMEVLNHQVPDLDDMERTRLSSFLSEYKAIAFKRKDFETYMALNTRNAQLRISLLIENKILEKVEGKGYKYQVKNRLRSSNSPVSACQCSWSSLHCQ